MNAKAQHKTAPRGIRNNNPGNIEYQAHNRWRGQLAYDPALESRFCRFESAHFGLRALALLLLNYYRRYRLTTLNKLITRFAPSHENNTRAYVKAVSTALGVKPEQSFELTGERLQALLAAIVQHENGQMPYAPDALAAAVREVL